MRRHSDALLAAALVCAALIELSLARDEIDQVGLRMVLSVAVCGCVAVRRAAPLATVLIASAVFTGMSLAGLAIESTAEVIAYLVLVFTLGERLDLRISLTGLVLASVGMVLETLGREAIGDVLFVLVLFLIAPWLIGRGVRARNERLHELRRLAAALDAERERAQALAAEAERTRIAREMHDVLSHSIGLIVLQAGAGERLAARDPAAARETLRTIAAAGHSALEELEGALLDDGGVPDLQTLVAGVRATGVDVELEHQPAADLPAEVAIATRRIVQEALTNVLKHAAARRVSVVVKESPESVDVLVEDDGAGAGNGGGTGRGLVGMRERAAVYNGELDAGPRPGGGFAVRARLRMDGR